MLTIVNGVTSKQVLANEIINLLETMGLDGYFYLGYPVLGGIDGKIKVDALLVSEQTGIVKIWKIKFSYWMNFIIIWKPS